MSTKRIKLIIFIALAAIISLLICSIFQIISINKKQDIIDAQQQEIIRLENELNFHQNQQSQNNVDDKQSDIGIEVTQ